MVVSISGELAGSACQYARPSVVTPMSGPPRCAIWSILPRRGLRPFADGLRGTSRLAQRVTREFHNAWEDRAYPSHDSVPVISCPIVGVRTVRGTTDPEDRGVRLQSSFRGSRG